MINGMKKMFYLVATVLAMAFVSCEENKDVKVTGVTLNKPELMLVVGGEETLVATVAPKNATNKDVEWSIDDPSVADVIDGLVKAKKAGTATIIVKTKEGNFTDDCELTVDAAIVPVTGVALPDDMTLTEGDEVPIEVTFTPSDATNKGVSWASTDSNVAEVVDGKVIAKTDGVATLTVITDDGEFMDDCVITVNRAAVPVTGIEVDKNTIKMSVGEKVTLVARVIPWNADNTNVIWTSSMPVVAEIEGDELTIKGTTNSSVLITATTEEGDFKAFISLTIEGVLINGVRWADRNVNTPGTFVASQENLGMYYQWGRNLAWDGSTTPATSADGSAWNNTGEAPGTTRITWPADVDPCPAGYRLPTKAEGAALANQIETIPVTHLWHQINDVNGRLFMDDASGATLFLPAGGLIIGTTGNPGSVGTYGYYWLNEASQSTGNRITVSATSVDSAAGTGSAFGMQVRCVMVTEE